MCKFYILLIEISYNIFNWCKSDNTGGIVPVISLALNDLGMEEIAEEKWENI